MLSGSYWFWLLISFVILSGGNLEKVCAQSVRLRKSCQGNNFEQRDLHFTYPVAHPATIKRQQLEERLHCSSITFLDVQSAMSRRVNVNLDTSITYWPQAAGPVSDSFRYQIVTKGGAHFRGRMVMEAVADANDAANVVISSDESETK